MSSDGDRGAGNFRPHVLYLSQYFHPEQFLNNHVARALVQEGHEVDVVCCVPNYPAGRFFEGYSNRKGREEVWDGVRVHRVLTVPRGRSAVQLVMNYLTYPVAAAWRILRLGRRRGDVSFVSMPSPLFQAFAGIFAKKIWGIPTVYWVQDIWPDSAIITLGIRNRVIVRGLEAICGWIYRQADLVMVQSDGFHSTIAAFGVPSDRIVTLPNCAPESFRPVESHEIPEWIRSLVPRGRRTIMFAGNIGESQDFDTIIEAVALLQDDCDCVIAVVGSGRDEERVRRCVAARRLSHRFLFLGRHPEHDMPAFFACADAMLVSLRDEPIFALTVPSKVQAYMACGKPILASLRGEGARIVADAGAGLTVNSSTPADLSIAIRQFAEMPDDDLTAMGCASRRAFEQRYSLAAVTTRLAAYLNLVARRRPANALTDVADET